MLNKAKNSIERHIDSFAEGTKAERLFVQMRADTFVRTATKHEDITEHWDVLDSELGKIDVKAAKRKNRQGPIDYTIWWELKTVARPPAQKSEKGWGVPNGIDRMIAIQSKTHFYLLKPESIIDDLRKRCTKWYKGVFGLYSRNGRKDLMTILPFWYIEKNAEIKMEILCQYQHQDKAKNGATF